MSRRWINALLATAVLAGCDFDQAFLDDCLERGACRVEDGAYCMAYHNTCSVGLPCCSGLKCGAAGSCERIGEPLLVFDPPRVDLGTVLAGEPARSATVQLKNVGEGPTTPLRLRLGALEAPLQFDVTACEGLELGAGQSCAIQVTSLAPPGPGQYAQSVTVEELRESESLRVAFTYDQWRLAVDLGTTNVYGWVNISVPLSCSSRYCSGWVVNGTPVTLTHKGVSSGYWFEGFFGCDAVEGATCTVTMDGPRTVHAATHANLRVTVVAHAPGWAPVTAPPPPPPSKVILTASGGSSSSYTSGQWSVPLAEPATLEAWAGPDEVFDHWEGACTGGDPVCVLQELPAVVSAIFAPKPQ